jgi:Zn-finger nucleic acid-binding protein
VLRPVRFGGADMYVCDSCNGLWVDPATLQHLVQDRLKPAPLVGTGIAAPAPSHVQLEHVQYAPCPICKTLMNRINFAHASGVIVDVCTNHGTWFDADELRRVIEFIRAGGVDASRKQEIEKLGAEVRRLRAERERPMGPRTPTGGNVVTSGARNVDLLSVLVSSFLKR